MQGPEEHKRTHKLSSGEQYHLGRREKIVFISLKEKSPFCKWWLECIV